jgi:hypothetical protein
MASSVSASHLCIPTITNCYIIPSSWKVSTTSRITWQKRGCCRAMIQVQTGAPAAYAKEMERLSAKESLLLAVSYLFSLMLLFDSIICFIFWIINVLYFSNFSYLLVFMLSFGLVN